jgi:hypothetical protein
MFTTSVELFGVATPMLGTHSSTDLLSSSSFRYFVSGPAFKPGSHEEYVYWTRFKVTKPASAKADDTVIQNVSNTKLETVRTLA